jgi:predicted transcriptional regulator YheO
MDKEEKTAAVEMMLERGLFMVRGGVERAATALGVTRFTVYNYLEDVKSRRGAARAAESRQRSM